MMLFCEPATAKLRASGIGALAAHELITAAVGLTPSSPVSGKALSVGAVSHPAIAAQRPNRQAWILVMDSSGKISCGVGLSGRYGVYASTFVLCPPALLPEITHSLPPALTPAA